MGQREGRKWVCELKLRERHYASHTTDSHSLRCEHILERRPQILVMTQAKAHPEGQWRSEEASTAGPFMEALEHSRKEATSCTTELGRVGGVLALHGRKASKSRWC